MLSAAAIKVLAAAGTGLAVAFLAWGFTTGWPIFSSGHSGGSSHYSAPIGNSGNGAGYCE